MLASRQKLFAAVAALCVIGAGVALLFGALSSHSSNTNARVGLDAHAIVVQGNPVQKARNVETSPDAPSAPPPPQVPISERGIEPGTRSPTPPHPATQRPSAVVVRAQNPGNPRLNGALTIVPIGGGTPKVDKLFCERIAFNAGRGICLSGLGTTSQVSILDEHFHTVKTLQVPGLPSRARVSPDGRYGAITDFVVGHAYATPGTFSTYTALIDLRRGTVITNLEKFATINNGKIVDAPDVNYWGVTFTGDSNRYYATLATGGRTYLVAGDIRRRQMWTLRQNVECPSLSPDGTRIAYKKLVGRAGHWRLHVLDLRTMRDTPLSEQRSIDDQAEWLDDDHVLYSDGSGVWSARADGTGRPRRLLTHAASPIVIWSPST